MGPSQSFAGFQGSDWPRSSQVHGEPGRQGGAGTLMHLVHIVKHAGWAKDPPGASG